MHTSLRRGSSFVVAVLITLSLGGCSKREPARQSSVGTVTAALNAAPKVSDFAVYAQNSATVRDRAVVNGGDVGVKNVGTGPFLETGFELALVNGARVETTRSVLGDSVRLTNRTIVGDVQTAHLSVGNPVTFNGPFAFPTTMPALPAAALANPGTTNVTVNAGQTVTISAGRFATVNVNVNGRLRLQAGSYDFASVQMANDSRIEALGVLDVRVAGRFAAIDRSHFVVAPGTALQAGSIRVQVSGQNGTNGALSASPKAVAFGNDSELVGLWLVPNGTLTTGQRSVVTGALVGRDVYVDIDARVNFQSGFPNPACVPANCDDQNPCTTDVCTNGTCSHAAKAAGTSCSDGNACTAGDTCQTGTCRSGASVPTDDGNACTTDSCDPASGVKHVPLPAGSSCTDGNPCNGAETCSVAGVCQQGTGVTCVALDQCHLAGTCQPATGTCTNPAKDDGSTCNDGDACTVGDSCQAGTCRPGVTVSIDDGNPCTQDVCHSSTGVSHAPTPAGTSCADSDTCNGDEICNGSGLCTPGVPLPAPRSPTVCETAQCVSGDGWKYTPLPPQTPCSDGDACNGFELCDGAGACAPGQPPPLDDGNACTQDLCDPSTGVRHPPLPDGSTCGDANVCNGQEVCQLGTCVGSTEGCQQCPAPTVWNTEAERCEFRDDFESDACGLKQTLLSKFQVQLGNVHVGGTDCGFADFPGHGHVVDLDGNLALSTTESRAEFPIGTYDLDFGLAGHPERDGIVTVEFGAFAKEYHVARGAPFTIIHESSVVLTASSRLRFVVPDSRVGTTPILAGPTLDDIVVVRRCSLLPPNVDDGNPCTIDSCDPLTGAVYTPVPDGTICAPGDLCAGKPELICRNALCGGHDETFVPNDANGYQYKVYGYGSVPADYGTFAFDDGDFDEGGAPFASGGGCAIQARRKTTWPLGTEIVLRRHLDLPPGAKNLKVRVAIDNDIEILFNETNVTGGLQTHEGCADSNQFEFVIPNSLVHPGNNLIAVRGRDRGAEAALDIALTGEAPGGSESEPPVLDDGNPCTIDACDPVTGVSHTPVDDGTSCSDANACNGEETCMGGSCVVTTPPPPPGDFASGPWSSLAPLGSARQHAAVGVINDLVYVAGGHSGSGVVPILEIYDSSTDQWSTGKPMATARAGAAAGVLGGKLYVAGGADSSGHVLSVMEVYDPILDQWASAPSMPTARNVPGSGVIAGRLYVVGGGISNTGGVYSNVVEAFDPATGWSTLTPLPVALAYPAAAGFAGKLYLFGGSLFGSVTGATQIFDPGAGPAGAWTTGAPMPVPRYAHAAAAFNGLLFVTGGDPSYGGESSESSLNEVYDPGANTWLAGPQLPNARWGLGLAAIDQSLVAIGGATAPGSGVASKLVEGLVPCHTPSNQPPAVDAGADQSVASTGTAVLAGTVTDDELPVGSVTQLAWAMVSGPGSVTFADPAAASTTATFSVPGTYVLRLTASDGALQAADEVTIRVDCVPSIVGTIPIPVPNGEPGAGVNDLAFVAPTGRLFASVFYNDNSLGDDAVLDLDPVERQINGAITVGGSPWGIAYNLVNSDILVANQKGSPGASIVDPLTHTLTRELYPALAMSQILVDPERRLVFVTQESSTLLRVLDAGTYDELAVLDLEVPRPSTMALDAHRGILYVSQNGASNTLVVVDATSLSIVDRLAIVSPTYLNFDPLGDRLFLSHDGSISVIDAATREVTATRVVSPGAGMSGIAYNPNTNHLFVSAHATNKVHVLDGTSLAEVSTIDGGNMGLALDMQHNRVFAAQRPLDIRFGNNPPGAVHVIDDCASSQRGPVVDAGFDQEIAFGGTVSLQGTATDDGLPGGSTLEVAWSAVSGPGTVVFGNPTAATTTATFSAPGTYVLQLSATDGELSTSDEVTIRTVTPACIPAPTGLVAWWPGDGDGALDFADDVLGENDGTPVGATYVPGKVAEAMHLDGSGVISITPDHQLDVGTGDFSVETWVSFDTLGLQVLFQKEIGFAIGTYLLETDNAGTPAQTTLRFLLIDHADINNRNDLIVPVAYSTGQWHHVAAVRTGNTSKLYLDGQLIGAKTAGNAIDPGNGGSAAIGRKPGAPIRHLSGSIDELGIYRRALSGAEVQSIHAAGGLGKCKDPQGNLVAVPGVVGQPLSAATTTIEAAELQVGTVVTSVEGALSPEFDVLPTQRGWQYSAEAHGSEEMLSEEAIFTASGGVLRMDSMSASMGGGCGNYYYRNGDVRSDGAWTLHVRARILDERRARPDNSFGFSFGAGATSAECSLGIGIQRIQDNAGRELSTAIDTTVFHDYDLQCDPIAETYRLFVDGVLIASNAMSHVGLNRMFFGDGTCGANALAEVAAFEFDQPVVAAQAPEGGTLVAPGSSVDLDLQTGPATSTVPPLLGLTQGQASASLDAAGLGAGRVRAWGSDDVPAGQIMSQKPVPGSRLRPGELVGYLLSEGHHDCSEGAPGLRALWRAELTTRDEVTSAFGQPFDGVSYVPAVGGSGWSFSRGYVEVPHSPAFEFSGEMSVEGWVRPNAWNSTILIKSDSTNASTWALSYEAGTNRAGFVMWDLSGASFSLVRSPNGTVPLGEWTHVAATVAPSGTRLYVDGALVSVGSGVFVGTNTGSLVIGANKRGGGRDGFFGGSVDELSVYARALTPAEILQVYAANVAGKCAITQNLPPTVNAGPDQVAVLSSATTLVGQVTDDGRPLGSPVTHLWSKVSGPGAVTFTNATSLSTTATFTLPGSYVLRLTASDGALSAFDEMSVTVTDTPVANEPPVVDAGPDRTVTEDEGVLIFGSYTDDGLPAGGSVSFSWSYDLGPIAPMFDVNTEATFDVLFPEPGTYELVLKVNDGELDGYDAVLVTVEPRVNEAPIVSAGPDRSITQPAGASLAGTVTDDDLPMGIISSIWTKVSGPGTVTFDSASSPATVAHFSQAGTYILRLTATDTALSDFDEVTVSVAPPLPNQAPLVAAGTDAVVHLPDTLLLPGNVVDDGLPVGSMLITSWELVSGPAPVTFSPGNAPTTTVTFTKAGIYVLRLNASDGALSGHDDVTVQVFDPPIGLPPDVAIASPIDGDDVTKPSDVLGTVTSEQLANWTLEYQSVGGTTWTEFATGTTPVANSLLAQLDSTLLLNGAYHLRLTATDTAGRFAQTTVGVVLSRNLKVGHFTVSFKDLSVPLAGIPIEVIRTYDSRNKQNGDFGVGWTLDIASVRLQKNRVLGQTWESTVEPAGPFGILEAFCIVPAKRHYVTVTFADGKVFRWEAKVKAPGSGYDGHPECQLGAQFAEAEVEFVPLAPTTASLSRLGGNSVIVNAAWPGEAELLATDGSTLFDPDKFVVTLHDGRALDVGSAGLEQIKDTNGNVLEVKATGLYHSTGASILFARDGQGRITSITDPEGHALTYGYGPTGDLLTYTDRVASTTTYAYDSGHFLLGIEDARGIQPIQNEYDAAGRLLSNTDAFGHSIDYDHQIVARTEVVTDRLGNSATHEYDDRGNVLTTTDALGNKTEYEYDDRDNKVTECNALDECSTFTYDAFDNKLTETDPLENTTEYEYDDRGNVTKVTDPLGHITTNTHDSAGNLKTTLDAAGQTTTYGYDARGLQTSMIDALGHTTGSTYDSNGNLLTDTDAAGHTTNYTYDANGNRLTQTTTRTTSAGAEALVTTFSYDAQGRLVSTIAADGSTTSTEYNEIGQVSATVDALGRRTKREYDDMGRLEKTIYPDATFETTGYDFEGRRIDSTDRAGRHTTFTYDTVGRLVTTTFPGGATTATSYDEAGRTATTTDEEGNVTSEEYDEAGRRVRTTDPLGHFTLSSYDDGGNQATTTDPLGNVTTFVYDELNRRTEVHFADSTVERTEFDALGRRTAKIDQAGVRTEYGYDALGRLVSVTDALGGITSYGYDEAGNQTTQVDALGHKTRFEYDRAGRRTRRTLPPVGTAPGAYEEMAYDDAGNLIAKSDFAGRTTIFAYDVVNRLLSRSYPDSSLVSFTYTPTGRRATMTDARGPTIYAYDTRDRVKSMTYPDGRSLAYGYDLRGARTSLTANAAGSPLTTSYAYDDDGRLTGVTDPETRSYTYGYDAAGRRTSLSQPNGTLTTYQYDTVNHLKQLETKHTLSSTTIQSYAYTLGATGIRTRIDEEGGIARVYAYDDLYRLTGETVTGTSGLDYAKTFTYDAVGNRLAQQTTGYNGASVTYTYDERDRLLTENTTSYGWDANGNMTTRVGDAENTWDFDDRLIRVTKADGTIVDHTYDADGVRVRTRVTPAGGGAVTTTEYLVDTAGALSHVVAETNGAGTLTAHYVRGGDQLLAMQRGATVRYYHHDGLGSVRALTDTGGGVTDSYGYTAFGEELGWTGAEAQPYRFAGEAWEGDISYHRLRYSSRSLGRFLSTDPFPGVPEQPITQHKYAYAEANPASNTDPTGAFTLSELSVATTVIGILSVAFPQSTGDGFAILKKGIFIIPSGSPLGQPHQTVTSWFGPRVLFAKGVPFLDHHGGIDLYTGGNRPVRATADGFVEAEGWVPPPYTGGIRVLIRHSQLYKTAYFHLRSENVRPGEYVRKGQVIGYSGNTNGNAAHPSTVPAHLHYTVIQGDRAIDPRPSVERGGVSLTPSGIVPIKTYYDYRYDVCYGEWCSDA